MLRVAKRLPAFAGVFIICLLVSMPAAAAAQTAGGSVIVSASIAPARYILVDSRGRIIEILSNSPSDVTPIVYRNKLTSTPIPLSPAIAGQYKSIMKYADARRAGVIYKAKPASHKKPAAIADWLRLKNYVRAASF